jgi:hypothetical protein
VYLCNLSTAVHNSAPIKTQAKKPPDSTRSASFSS